jgi:hypothetical protein
MKKIIYIAAAAFCISFTSVASAQEHKTDVTKEVKKGAKKTGQKTAEVASKGKAKVTDQVHKDKIGPNGETIYIDNHSRYYWVDKKGRRHYMTAAQLKDKPKDQ